MEEIARYSGCFVCGENNNIGLRAKFYFNEGKAITEYTAERRFEGYRDIFHGGITATLLDEVMIKAILARGIYAMTVELNVRFHRPVNIGQKLFLEGAITREQGRLFYTLGEAKTEDNEAVATASGKYVRVKDDMKVKLLRSLER